MAGKYDRLIKPLSIGIRTWEAPAGGQAKPGASIVGPGNAKKEVWLNGREHLEGVGFNISWGVHNTVGDWHSAGRAHTHSYPECLFFVGLDTASVNYLGAEVECCLGSEKEPYTFNEPTVVIVPAGVPHGPISTKRLFSPRGFGFFAAGLSADSNLAWVGEAGGPGKATGQYAHLVKSLKPGMFVERGKFNAARVTVEQLEKGVEQLQRLKDAGRLPTMLQAQAKQDPKRNGVKLLGPGHPDHLTWMYGKDLGGVDANIAWGFCSQPGIWQRGMEGHSHLADEVVIFLGIDPNSDELGAEIEIDLGAEHERHLIDKSCAVVCPAGLLHAPLVTRWVDKPFAYLSVNLAAEMKLITEECLQHQTKSGSESVQEGK